MPSLSKNRSDVPDDLLERGSPRETRQRILIAAGPIFADKGFDASTVREICESANVNVASIKYHFGDKRGLYHETVLLAHASRAEMFADREVMSPDPRRRLADYIQRILFSMAVNEQGPWQVRLLMNEIQTPSDSCRQLVRDEFRPFVQGLMSTIVELAGRPLPTDLQVTLAMSVIGQCMIYRFAPETHAMTMNWQSEETAAQPPDQQQLSTMATTITKFSLAGILAAVQSNE